MATIAELQTKITADNTQFKKSINESTNFIQNFTNKAKTGFNVVAGVVAGALTASMATLGSIMQGAQKRVSDLVDTSTRLGAGIPELQRLQYAAQQSGVSIESMNGSLGRMLRLSASAAQGSKAASDALSSLGINAENFIHLGVDQQFVQVSEAIKKLPTAAQQAKAAFEIFGKRGVELLSLMKDDVSGLINEYKGLGIELTSTQAKNLESYGDTVSKLGTVWEGFKNQLAAALAGPFKRILDWIVQTSIDMGGLGNAAQMVAKFILSAGSGLVSFFGTIYRGIQSTIVAVEELLVVLLKLNQFGTLGLSNLDLPFGLGNTGSKIQALRQDINQRSANILSAQQAQQKIQVEINAASGFVATVVNSPENRNAIETTINNQIGTIANGGI